MFGQTVTHKSNTWLMMRKKLAAGAQNWSPEPKRICENPMRKLFGAAMCHMLAVMMMKNLADPGRHVTCRSTRDPPPWVYLSYNFFKYAGNCPEGRNSRL